VQLLELFVDVRGDSGVPDVCVDLTEAFDANTHRFHFRMVYVGGNNHSPSSDFGPDQFRRDLLAVGYIEHFFRDQTLAREVHLRHVGVAGSCRFFATPNNPGLAQLLNSFSGADYRFVSEIACHTLL
jgi:hypothetical protein